MAGENLNQWVDHPRLDGEEGIRRRQLTEDETYDFALVSLGAPFVDVEVDKSTLKVFMMATLDVYNRWMPVFRWGSFVPGSSQFAGSYNFRSLSLPFGRGLVECKLMTREQYFSPVSGVFALGIPHPISHLAPDQYDLALRYIKTAQNVYSSFFEWEWQEPVLYIHAPGYVQGPSELSYKYLIGASKPEDIPEWDIPWFKDYFRYKVQEAAGRVRSKFANLPGPASMTLDGGEMYRDATDNLRRLEEELRDRSSMLTPPLPPGG